MSNALPPLRRALALRWLLGLCLLLASLPVFAADKARLRIDDYVIDAELLPKPHKLQAHAKVKFTALDDLSVAVFELHNALRPTKITDAAGHTLSAERVTQDSTLRIALPSGLAKGETTTLNFDYEGTLSSADESPVEGLKLAYIGDDISYLFYAGRWFPSSGYGMNRFIATINVTVPTGIKVIGSGPVAATARPTVSGKNTYSFQWEKPSFPGTIIAGAFEEASSNAGGYTIRTYFKPKKKTLSPAYMETATKELEYFSSLYGPAPSTSLSIVELPDDTLPSAWAPGVAALATRSIVEKTNYRLLANTIAHQWWGVSVSPATRDDFWITDGGARYAEVRYVENAAGAGAFEEATKDMSVGALAYDNVPLASVGKLDVFSPEFQSLVTDKGGMIFHMLRWVVGSEPFDKAVRTLLTQFAGKPIRTDNFRSAAESASGEQLTPFFSQWLDGTGAPEFKNKYSVFRLGSNKGFRVVGEISQDLDLFRMPLEVRVDTDGKSEMKRIEVAGTRSAYSIETFGKPRHITLDPNSWVLKSSDDFKVRVSILRGQQLVAQGDLAEALKEYNHALESNKNSSLAHYRVAEVFFLQHNYQAAANAYREAERGDGDPRWTEVWSHVQLGKIFDITGQRDRATNEYRQALQTNDNTQGALDEARRYLANPYKKEKEQANT